MTDSEKTKCHAIIHSAATAAGAVGAGLAQLPMSDNLGHYADTDCNGRLIRCCCDNLRNIVFILDKCNLIPLEYQPYLNIIKEFTR